MFKLPWVGEIKVVETKKTTYSGGTNIGGCIKSSNNQKLTLVLRDREQFDTYINRTFKAGDKVWMTVEKPHKDRTHRQFRYLYGAIYPLIAEEIGCTIEEADGIMRRRLLIMNPDSRLEYIRNKSNLNRKELSDYIDGVRREAAGMGIETPDPPDVEVNDVKED